MILTCMVKYEFEVAVNGLTKVLIWYFSRDSPPLDDQALYYLKMAQAYNGGVITAVYGCVLTF